MQSMFLKILRSHHWTNIKLVYKVVLSSLYLIFAPHANIKLCEFKNK